MYFPILWGKQYELLALREFSSEFGAEPVISPVIEPVKLEFKALETACTYLTKSRVNFTVIVNPRVGDITDPTALIAQVAAIECLLHNSNFQVGVNCINQQRTEAVIQLLRDQKLNKEIAFFHHEPFDLEFYSNVERDGLRIKYNFIDTNIRSRRFKHQFGQPTKIELEDVFDVQAKNADYSLVEDQLFSEAHLYYAEEGYIGFSDYLTIGEEYVDGGFLPYAVAIHLTYQAVDGEIRIHHFVSDSNDDYHDTPGKFAEALSKLVEFTRQLRHKTRAIKILENYHAAKHYPGLGSIKKLSILNHLELVNRILTTA